jgi:hypothetical protein
LREIVPQRGEGGKETNIKSYYYWNYEEVMTTISNYYNLIFFFAYGNNLKELRKISATRAGFGVVWVFGFVGLIYTLGYDKYLEKIPLTIIFLGIGFFLFLICFLIIISISNGFEQLEAEQPEEIFKNIVKGVSKISLKPFRILIFYFFPSLVFLFYGLFFVYLFPRLEVGRRFQDYILNININTGGFEAILYLFLVVLLPLVLTRSEYNLRIPKDEVEPQGDIGILKKYIYGVHFIFHGLFLSVFSVIMAISNLFKKQWSSYKFSKA